jgi:putative ABC transport system substrate-binding protein
MKRREFITLLGGTAAGWPLAARAQQRERMRRIGILMPFPPTNVEMQARVRAFREELRKHGWAASVNAVMPCLTAPRYLNEDTRWM